MLFPLNAALGVFVMAYDQVMIDEDGEEYPFSSSIDEDGYLYRVSVVFDDRDGEWIILNLGSHIEFDDDGSWLDFNIAPEDMFPSKDKLQDVEILEFMHHCSCNMENAKTYTKDEMMVLYQKYKQITGNHS